MSTLATALAIVATAIASSQTFARDVTYEMVNVGDANTFVPYSFGIGKYDVSIAQYTAFLNAVAKSDPYHLYNTNMGFDLNVAGISRAGVSGSYTYSVMNNGGYSGNRPITYVNWWDAARFANWMQNGQGSGSTETGAYTLNGATSGITPDPNPGTTYRLPTISEFYKAAYYSPLLNSKAGGYYTYATQSDYTPGNVVGGGSNEVNYWNGVFSVTQSENYDPNQNYLTDVGAFSNSKSYYGAFDITGNVFWWGELSRHYTQGNIDNRGVYGGSWWEDYTFIWKNNQWMADATLENSEIGIRLATVPEVDPSGVGSVLALLGGAIGLLERRRPKPAA